MCLWAELGVPSSVDLVCSDPAHLVTSFNNGQIGLFNMETGQLVLTLESSVEPSKHPPTPSMSRERGFHGHSARSMVPGHTLCCG